MPISAMAFDAARRNDLLKADDYLHAAYRLQVNHYRGDSTAELYIEHSERLDTVG